MSKKGSSSTEKIVLIFVIALIIGVVKGCNFLVDYFSEGTAEEQAQIVMEFEKKVHSITSKIEEIDKQIAEELSNFVDGEIRI